MKMHGENIGDDRWYTVEGSLEPDNFQPPFCMTLMVGSGPIDFLCKAGSAHTAQKT